MSENTETQPRTTTPDGEWITGHAMAALRAGTPRAAIEQMLADRFGLAPGEAAWVLRLAQDYLSWRSEAAQREAAERAA